MSLSADVRKAGSAVLDDLRERLKADKGVHLESANGSFDPEPLVRIVTDSAIAMSKLKLHS